MPIYILILKRCEFGFSDHDCSMTLIAICGCTKFLHRMGHVPIREKVEHGPNLCVWGMLSPKLYTKCGRPLDG
jgi:hypothetical protein